MVNGQALPSPPETVQTTQPKVSEPMSECKSSPIPSKKTDIEPFAQIHSGRIPTTKADYEAATAAGCVPAGSASSFPARFPATSASFRMDKGVFLWRNGLAMEWVIEN